MIAPDADAFWSWSTAFYAKPGVAEACLELQDRDGAEVNLVLLLLWLAEEGYAPLGQGEVAALDRAVRPWREKVVEPLRALRNALKGQGEDTVRRAILSAELVAERSTQRRLVAALPALSESEAVPESIAARNLEAHGGLAPEPRAILIGALTQG
jgi:uncharacterized protein (TIGR02444 family)